MSHGSGKRAYTVPTFLRRGGLLHLGVPSGGLVSAVSGIASGQVNRLAVGMLNRYQRDLCGLGMDLRLSLALTVLFVDILVFSYSWSMVERIDGTRSVSFSV